MVIGIFVKLVPENLSFARIGDGWSGTWSGPRRSVPSSTLPGEPMNRIDAAIAIVTRGDKVLICQRKDDDTLGGYWEFPGGKQEDGETLHECLARELREELAIRARPVTQLTTVQHDYPHVQLRLHPFVCAHED